MMNSRLPGLSDMPLGLKMSLPAMLALGGMIFLCIFGLVENRTQTQLMAEVVDRDMASATQLLQSVAELQGTNGRLYRLLTLRDAHMPNLDTGTEIAALRTRIEAVRQRLGGVQGRIGDPDQVAALVRARADLAAYRDTVTAMGKSAGGDGAAALDMVRQFDGLSRGMIVTLSQLADNVLRDATRRAQDCQQQSRELQMVFLATAGLVLLLVAACGMTITRRTVRSVRKIAQATMLIANGDQSFRIHTLARRDELGAIVESLRAFQANNKRINFLAYHDPLTALPNRALFHDRLVLALEQCQTGLRCAVHSLDLDHFKAVNDTLGHPIGDALLQCVAARLTRCVREGDTVARLGGDEFAIIQLDVDGEAGASGMAQRVIDTVSQPYEINGHQIIIGTSIGVALTPCETMTVEGLPCNADLALYRAKSEGRCTWRFYAPDMDTAMQQRRLLEMDMRAALAGAQFEMYYQPLVNVQTREVTGFEALLRWHHPERGTVPPAEFIPLAEETGMIVQIGAWVLRQACADAATWPASMKVAVNLSPLQFRDSNLVSVVVQALSAAGLPAWRLELEITEGVLLHDNDQTLETLHKLRALGICISMDDFGTGYSSLSYLRSFPFDKIKIDQSFIRDLARQTGAAHAGSVAIVRAVTGLSSSLGIHTTAEGVETEDQFSQLIAEGCTEVQGYLFSPPCPAGDVARIIAEISERPAVGLIAVKPESAVS